MNLGLEGRVCVVTGGTRGIGAATARMLSQEGARVLTVARHGADLELDVTAPDAGERLLDACPEAPWALVNSAGTSQARPLEELTDADWQQQWELHVMAPMRLMRALAPAMAAAGGGRIVNVSSSSGRRPSRRLDASYSVTKAAQLSLSRVFADAVRGAGRAGERRHARARSRASSGRRRAAWRTRSPRARAPPARRCWPRRARARRSAAWAPTTRSPR